MQHWDLTTFQLLHHLEGPVSVTRKYFSPHEQCLIHSDLQTIITLSLAGQRKITSGHKKNKFLRNRIQNVTSCYNEGIQLQCLYCHTMYCNISDQQETVVCCLHCSNYDHRVHHTSSSKTCSCSHLNKY